MAIKKIDFEKSLYYFSKDSRVYVPCECHINTYKHFDSCNGEEIDSHPSSFKFVTGLLLANSGNKKLMYVHSWIEKDGAVIDVTQFANNPFLQKHVISEEQMTCMKEKLLTETRYLNVRSITNKQYWEVMQNMGFKARGDQEKSDKLIEEFLQGIVESVEKDKIVEKQKNEFGFTLLDKEKTYFSL